VEPAEPSALFRSERARLARARQLGPVADLACGRGRHALAAAELGASVVALDRDSRSLRALADQALQDQAAIRCVRSDLETSLGLPLAPESCGAILVFRFLFRPLADAIVACLRPGGLLLYETFTIHQRQVAHGPRNPAFLLHPGELRELFAELEPRRYEEGWFGDPPEALARLVARKSHAG
jgi:SAM-dependent methyltransferase